MKKNNVILFSLIFLFVIVAPSVLGANMLDNILQPFKGIDIGATYLRYAVFIDAIIFFWFFIALTKGIFKEKFPTSVATAVGIMLGIGMAVFESMSHFNLGMMAPFAALIFFMVLGVMLFTWAKNLGDNGLFAFSLSFIVIYSLVFTIAKPLVTWIEKVPFLAAVLGIALVASIIGLVVGIFRMIGNITSGKFGVDKSISESRNNDRLAERTSREEKRALKKLDNAEKNVLNIQRHMNDLNNSLQKVTALENEYSQRDKLTRQEQADLLRQLYAALNNTEKAQAAIQKVINNINNPEYRESRDEINEHAKTLNEYLNTINSLILKLDQSIKNSIKNDDERKVQEKEYTNASKDLFTTEKQIESIEKSLDVIKNIDQLEYAKLMELWKKHQKATDFYSLFAKVAEEDEKIHPIDKEIKELDEKNLNEIDRCLRILSSDGTNDVSTLSKGIGVLANSKDDREAIRDSFKESKLQGLMYDNMNKIVALMNERNKVVSNKINLTQTYKKLSDTEISDIRLFLKTELGKLKDNFKSDVGLFTTLVKDYKAKITTPHVLPGNLNVIEINEFAEWVKKVFDSSKYKITNRQNNVRTVGTRIITTLSDLSKVTKRYTDAEDIVKKDLEREQKVLENILESIIKEEQLLTDFVDTYK